MHDRVRSQDWKGATLAAVVRAARVAFDPEFRDRQNLRYLREFYVRETKASTSQAYLGAMMSIYLGSYEPDARHTKDMAAALDCSRSRLGDRWSQLLNNVPYLLDPVRAGQRIGQSMRNMDDAWTGLRKLGFQDPHSQGLLHYAHLAYVEEMQPALKTLDGAQRMLAWLKPKGRDALAGGAAQAIDALLGPWISAEPPEPLRNRLIEGLVGCYGDPRVRSGVVWTSVDDSRKGVMLRWLTGANMQFFLDVVSEVEDSHMWQPRREFWWDLYEERRIDAAWVAFSPRAVSTAQHMAKHEEAPLKLAYGEQTAGGSRKNTSLLILKIGSCIVVEGSHNYKVHVFRSDNLGAPSLFKEKYDCEDIRKAPGPEHRAQAHLGNWQDRVREWIEYWS